MPVHGSITPGYVHVPYNWTYADSTARLGASGFASEDVGKFARQLDNNSVWMLTAITPTWLRISYTATPADLALAQIMWGLKIEAAVTPSKVRVYQGIASSAGGDIMIEVPPGEYREADLTVSGVGGLDTGSEAANTWYAVWLIYNPTTEAVALLLSTSATSPTVPGGYTKKRLLGYIRNDASANIVPMTSKLLGACRRVHYHQQFTALSGATETTWTDLSLATWMSPAAEIALFHAKIDGTATETAYLRPKGETAVHRTVESFKTGLVALDMHVDANQTIQYQVVAGATFGIVLHGYFEHV